MNSSSTITLENSTSDPKEPAVSSETYVTEQEGTTTNFNEIRTESNIKPTSLEVSKVEHSTTRMELTEEGKLSRICVQ